MTQKTLPCCTRCRLVALSPGPWKAGLLIELAKTHSSDADLEEAVLHS